MCGRFLYAWPSAPDYRPLTNEAAEVEPELQSALTALIRLPSEDVEGAFTPQTICLSDGAIAEFEGFRKWVDNTKRGIDGHERQWLVKGETVVLRLAGTLAYMAWAISLGAPPTNGLDGITGALEPKTIDEQFMTAAIRLWREFLLATCARGPAADRIERSPPGSTPRPAMDQGPRQERGLARGYSPRGAWTKARRRADTRPARRLGEGRLDEKGHDQDGRARKAPVEDQSKTVRLACGKCGKCAKRLRLDIPLGLCAVRALPAPPLLIVFAAKILIRTAPIDSGRAQIWYWRDDRVLIGNGITGQPASAIPGLLCWRATASEARLQ